MAQDFPSFEIEEAARRRGFVRIAGVDEVGRGPLAGPVTAAAVVLDIDCLPDGLNDSKKLAAKRREALAPEIERLADFSVAHASVEEIDEINILHASMLAMRRAILALDPTPDFVLIDGNRLPPDLPMPGQSVVKGDAKSLSIAAASIVAKCVRDKIMWDLAQQFPGYGWETNAGYPSSVHKKALRDLGVTPHHRRSFKPVHNILYQEKIVSD